MAFLQIGEVAGGCGECEGQFLEIFPEYYQACAYIVMWLTLVILADEKMLLVVEGLVVVHCVVARPAPSGVANAVQAQG